MSALRRIGALDLPNVTPADISSAPLPMLEWLDVDDLWVDPAYQRDISPAALRLIANLVENWDWLKCGPLLVALTENGFEVYDGQCRATAGRLHPQITSLPAYVVDGSTLPQRAGAFVAHARTRVVVTPGQVHRASVTAGDADAMAIDAACRAAGVRLLPFSPPFGVSFQVGDTVALASVRTMLARRGAERTIEILRALVTAGLAPISAQHLRAGEALLCEPEYAADFGAEQLTAALQAASPGMAAEVRALAAAKGLPGWRALVAVLFKHRGRAKPRQSEQAQVTTFEPNANSDLGSNRAPESTASPGPSKTDSTAVRAPGKGTYRASGASTDGRLRDRDSAAPNPAPRPQVQHVVDLPGTPPPGRSALDQRKATR